MRTILFRGVIGFGGHESARMALLDRDVDTILAIGTNLGEWASNGWDSDALLNSRLIHVDNNEEHLTHSPMARMHVRGHLLTVVRYLLERVRQDRPFGEAVAGRKEDAAPSGVVTPLALPFQLDDEAAYRSDATPIKPQRLMRELAKRFPLKTRFLADTGNSQAWAIHYLHPPGRRVTGQRDCCVGNFRAYLEFAPWGGPSARRSARRWAAARRRSCPLPATAAC
ncbi:hypothetical protein [Methylogaea oryzae]|uniref:hypothetical protein n=1 Tax=Methylogaea oryzae TaxID=1295382 RepID=UPI000B2512BF|nr:hypothetical protein [Methylogaea oryzae]